jgi:predicted ester cyclase
MPGVTHSSRTAGVTTTEQAARDIAMRSIQIMVNGSRADFAELIHPDAHNREAVAEPPATRGRGPDAFWATAMWLRGAFADLAFEVHEVVGQGDLVAVHGTMSGRQTGTIIMYGPDGRPAQAFPATGRPFATTQTHWLRIADGRVVEHWANRDDVGTGAQLGWTPPSPVYLLRMALATRRARRAARR